MAECCRQLTFSFYQDRQLVADFKGGQISSDTGLLAVRQLDEKLGWLAQAASLISDPRREDRTELGVRLRGGKGWVSSSGLSRDGALSCAPGRSGHPCTSGWTSA